MTTQNGECKSVNTGCGSKMGVVDCDLTKKGLIKHMGMQPLTFSNCDSPIPNAPCMENLPTFTPKMAQM